MVPRFLSLSPFRFLLSLCSFATLSLLALAPFFPPLSLLATFCRLLSFYAFPRCTIIEFAELKAPPPSLHYVTLWGLLSFIQIAF